MRNADLDDMRDKNYKEAVAAEWKEIRAVDEKKTQTTPRYTFHKIPNRIKGWMGQRRPWFEIKKPNGIVVFATSDEGEAQNTYQLLCEAFNEGQKHA